MFSFLLQQEMEYRKLARNEGRRYCDPVVLTYQAERMPEQIRLKVRLEFTKKSQVFLRNQFHCFRLRLPTVCPGKQPRL